MIIYTVINDNGLNNYTRNGLIDLVVVNYRQNIRTAKQAIEYLKTLNYAIWQTELQNGRNK